jgi:hypothetical protein
MEAVYPSETLILTYHTTWHHNPQDHNMLDVVFLPITDYEPPGKDVEGSGRGLV